MNELRGLLRDTFVHIQPAATVDDLSPDDAVVRVAGAPHSIAEIIAHVAFWQDWFLARCRREPRAMVTSAAQGWPQIDAAGWSELRTRFLADVDAAVALSEDPGRIAQPLSPPIDFPPLAAYTVGDALTHVAIHNAHHLGQVITLRQVMGRWPPPAGSWTW
jgi:uncharacterized damage-inducible protein DinB